MRKYSFSDLLYSADINEGKCLSKEYADLNTLVEWRCKKAHRFSMSYKLVRQGAWCQQCVKEDQKQLKLEAYHKYAKSQGGKCLATTYKSAAHKISWECKNGHQWKQIFSNIEKYGWCNKCRKEEKNLLYFEKIKLAAEKKGGKCLAKKYLSAHQLMSWQCKEGHLWKTQATHILNEHSWCPHCAGKAKHTIAQMQTIARQKKGKCLSESYKNSVSKLRWQCTKGHTWNAAPVKVLSGQWCPTCRYEVVADKLKTDISKVRDLARAKGGILLSKEYINALTPVQWKCKEGHIWFAKSAYVKHHSWCPVCARIKK